MNTQSSPIITDMQVIPVAGHDSMLMNIGGAHGAYFTRNIVILKDSAGNTGVGEAPGGEVILRAANEDGSPLIEVLDTGPGIPEAEREAVFQRFYRCDDKHSGFGLGLSIVAAIVNLHGFNLEVGSRKGGGARLTLHCRQSLINVG